MLDSSVSYFLSNYWRNAPLYAEKIIPLLDTCLSSNYALSDKVSNAFFELINKYQNTAELPLENLKEFIREQGYGYILDLVIQNEESVKALWYILVLIHNLKGSKQGILLVLSLFENNFDPSKTKIEQWYETIPVGKENTFTLESTIDVSKMGDGFFKNFQTFVSNYVYPELLALKVNYAIDGRITYRPYSRAKFTCEVKFHSADTYSNGFADDSYLRYPYDGGPAKDFLTTVSTYHFLLKGDLNSEDSDLKLGDNFLYNSVSHTYIAEDLSLAIGRYKLLEVLSTENIAGQIYTHVRVKDFLGESELLLKGDLTSPGANLHVGDRFAFNSETNIYVKEDLPQTYGIYQLIGTYDTEEINGEIYTNVAAQDVVRDMISYIEYELPLIGDISDLPKYTRFQYDPDTKDYIKEDLTLETPIYGDYMFIRTISSEEIDGILYTNVIAEKPVEGGWV